MDPLEELVRKYRSFDDIPEEVLTQHGLVRQRTASGTRIVTKAQAKKLEERAAEKAPFGPISVEVKTTKTTRSLHGQLGYAARTILRDITEIFLEQQDEPYETLFSTKGTPRHAFADRFKQWLTDRYGGKLPFTFYLYFGLNDSPYAAGIEFPQFERSEPHEHFTQAYVERLLTQLTKLKAQLNDPDQHSYERTFEQPVDNERFTYYLEHTDFTNDLLERIQPTIMNSDGTKKTTIEVVRHYLGEYLETHGFDEVAKRVKRAATRVDLVAALEQTRFLPGRARVRELREALRKAEDPREYSGALREAKAQLKKEAAFLQAAIAFVEPYRIVRDTGVSLIKQFEKLALVGMRGTKRLTLDGTPDMDKDSDPGKIVVDCTAGRPLPFWHPDVHNVKVYDGPVRLEEQDGNIYLIEGTYSVPKKRGLRLKGSTWHLDAIQIPLNLDWKTAFSAIIERLGLEAERQGIDYITINDRSPIISNFDFIGNAALEFHRASNLPKGYVQLPKIPKSSYESRFQYEEGGALVVWKRE